MRRSALLFLPALWLVGCPWESAWLLPEKDAITMARAELAKRSVHIDDVTHTLSNIQTGLGDSSSGTVTVSFTLDGWDPAHQIGIEYIESDDPDFGPGTPFSDIKPSEALQSAVDSALAGQARVLILHQWAHETESLCRDQFADELRHRLDTLGIK